MTNLPYVHRSSVFGGLTLWNMVGDRQSELKMGTGGDLQPIQWGRNISR
jgi:hypothetical protein